MRHAGREQWLGVPDSPGPRHAFTPGYDTAVCGAYRHRRDRNYGGRGRCAECARLVTRRSAMARKGIKV